MDLQSLGAPTDRVPGIREGPDGMRADKIPKTILNVVVVPTVAIGS
jgi:hypothetical protein